MIAACPSSLLIARWEAGRITDGAERHRVGAHARVCARCADLVADIAAAREALLSGDGAAEAARAAHTLFVTAAARAARSAPPRPRPWLALARLSALAFGAVLLAPAMRHDPRTPVSIASSERVNAQRAKGQLLVQVFCKRADAVFPVEDGGAFYRGDRLRFAYSTVTAGHLMVLGVDDRGRIFPYYGEGRLASVPAVAGAGIMLPGSVELDDHHGAERVFALWAKAPIDGGAVERAVADALSAGGGDIARAAKLPVGIDQVSFLLQRP
ncbi:MAG TPA: hypothetical protein VMU50_14755 [Polyangia bacterium]|nr:hypothetical protein [Polyangia bacterium]